MRSKQVKSKAPAHAVVKDIRRATRKQYSAEEKILKFLYSKFQQCDLPNLIG